jgi:signal transduction histidine kinase
VERPRRAGLILVGAGCVGAGIGSLAIARHAPAASIAGGSAADAAVELGAGWGLCLVGGALVDRGRRVVGALLLVAGVFWFAPEWANPSVGSSLLFTAGLVASLATLPLVAHAALAYPDGRLRSTLDRPFVAASYAAAIGFAGVAPAVAFDPRASGCFACPQNLLLVHGDAAAYGWMTRWGLRLEFVLAVALGALLLRRLFQSRARLLAPVAIPALAYLLVAAVDLRHEAATGGLGNDATELRLWRLEGIGLIMVAAGVAWQLRRWERTRRELARLALDLASASQPGARQALAGVLGDPTLELAYGWSGGDGFVDADGAAVDLAPGPDQTVTTLERGGRPLAALVHRHTLRDDPALVEDAVSAMLLELESERNEADLRAQVRHLRESRSRIVESADLARRRLERDLHDGAQQRFVGVSLALRLLRRDADADIDARLASAEIELQAVLADLRELAHGIFPAVLIDEGLTAALETLAATSTVEMRLRELPDERLTPAAETAAYFAIAHVLAHDPRRVDVFVRRCNGSLVVELEADLEPRVNFTDIEDRVGAVDGTVAVTSTDRGVRLYLEVPCA